MLAEWRKQAAAAACTPPPVLLWCLRCMQAFIFWTGLLSLWSTSIPTYGTFGLLYPRIYLYVLAVLHLVLFACLYMQVAAALALCSVFSYSIIAYTGMCMYCWCLSKLVANVEIARFQDWRYLIRRIVNAPMALGVSSKPSCFAWPATLDSELKFSDSIVA